MLEKENNEGVKYLFNSIISIVTWSLGLNSRQEALIAKQA